MVAKNSARSARKSWADLAPHVSKWIGAWIHSDGRGVSQLQGPRGLARCQTGTMERALPPAEERFDPITGRWINAPLPDPARTWVDPAGDAPVTVVGEIPPELSEHDRPPPLPSR